MEIPWRYRSSVGVSLEGGCFPGETSPPARWVYVDLRYPGGFHVLQYGDSIPTAAPLLQCCSSAPAAASMDAGGSLLLPALWPGVPRAHGDFPRE